MHAQPVLAAEIQVSFAWNISFLNRQRLKFFKKTALLDYPGTTAREACLHLLQRPPRWSQSGHRAVRMHRYRQALAISELNRHGDMLPGVFQMHDLGG